MKEREDFLNYEGNAQGFRVLVKLQTPDKRGGMQLTCSTLAAYTKYPRESFLPPTWEGKSFKKWGFFQDDSDLFNEVATTVGLIKRKEPYNCWCRHPLSFLVEAGDDITYRIIDLEDAYRTGHIKYDEFKHYTEKIIDDTNSHLYLDKIKGEKEKIEFLRAKSINRLIHEIVDIFLKYDDSILNGEFDDDLLKHVDSNMSLSEIKTISKAKAYSAREVVEIEAAGFHVLGRLLQIFLSAIEDLAKNGTEKAAFRSKKIIELLPPQFLGLKGLPDMDKYSRIIKITDFVSGMTDRYAVNLYKKLTGISLP